MVNMVITYEHLISFILAFIVALCATPIAKKIAVKLGAVDIPKDDRRVHKKPIARLGGLAIVTGFFMAILFNIFNDMANDSIYFALNKQMKGLLAGILIIVAVGMVDDIYQLKAKVKLVFQIIAAVIVVASGTKIEVIYGITEISPYITIPLTICWIVGITNAINLIDGLDGLAAGVSSIASLSLFFVSLIFNRLDAAIITAILAGSTLGFLPYNFNPAKIFMGDTGSTFLGFTLAVISIQGTLKSYTLVAIAIPLLVLGLPLFDTIFAVLRRLVSGKSIMEADRGHLHHKLIDMGLSQRQSVVAMYAASGALGLCAVVLAGKGAISAIIMISAVSIFIIGGAKYMSDMSDSDEDEEIEDDEKKMNSQINIKHEGIK